MEGRQWVGVRVCGALVMGPKYLDFICGCQGAAVLREEGCGGQIVSDQRGGRGSRWMGGGEVEGPELGV